MKRIFTMGLTLLMMGSTNLMSADINVTPLDDLAVFIAEAEAGDVLILADGEYTTEETVNLTKSITIKAENEGKAILNQFQFVVPADASIENVLFDGIVAKHDPTVDSKYFFQVNTATSAVTNLTLKNSTVSGYGRGVIRGTTENATLDNLTIDNCIFTENSNMSAGYGHINTQKVNVKTVKVTNSTFYNSKAAIFRYEGKTEIDFLFENCTVVNCGSASSRSMMEVGSAVVTSSTFKVKNCIFTGSYDAAAPASKPIDFRNMGDVENSLLEGYSEKLVNRTTETTPVEGSVDSFDFSQLTMATTPATITGIGDPRWTLNSSSSIAESANSNKEIISVTYFDLFGNKVTENAKGLVIKKTVYEDGSSNTVKVIKN